MAILHLYLLVLLQAMRAASSDALGREWSVNSTPSVAVYLQCSQNKNLEVIMQCISNIAAATALVEFTLDVHITFVQSFDKEVENNIISRVKSLEGVRHVQAQWHIDAGFDIGPFLKQLHHTIAAKDTYDIAFKIHTKSDREWLQHCVDCLCGTPSHVASIISNFVSPENNDIGMIAAQGTVFSSLTERRKVAPFLLRKLFHNQELWLAFQKDVLENMTILYHRLFPDREETITFAREEAIIAAGTIFWVRFQDLNAEHIVRALPWLQLELSSSYRKDGRIEHTLERLLPSIIRKRGEDTVHEMPPALKPMMLVHPQMRNGINDILKYRGVGLVYMYYWPYDHDDITPLLHSVDLSEGPFMLALGPAPLVQAHGGRNVTVASVSDWHRHFNYILPFLLHPNYVSVGGEPVFLVKISSLPSGGILYEMISVWLELCHQHGLKGIYFIAYVSDGENNSYDFSEVIPIWSANTSNPIRAVAYFPTSPDVIFNVLNASLDSLAVSCTGDVIKIGDLITILVTPMIGQTAKIIKLIMRGGEKVAKVRVLQYIGRPLVVLKLSEITVMDQQTWPIPTIDYHKEVLRWSEAMGFDEQVAIVNSISFGSEARVDIFKRNLNVIMSCNDVKQRDRYQVVDYLFISPIPTWPLHQNKDSELYHDIQHQISSKKGESSAGRRHTDISKMMRFQLYLRVLLNDLNHIPSRAFDPK